MSVNRKKVIIEKLNEIHKTILEEYREQIPATYENKTLVKHGEFQCTEQIEITSDVFSPNMSMTEFIQKDQRVLKEANYYICITSGGNNRPDQLVIDALREKVFQLLLEKQIKGYYFAGTLKNAEKFTEITLHNIKNNSRIDILHTYDNKKHRNSNMATHIFIHIDTHKQNTLWLPKPFLLLAGISGTGKTRFVREQAKQTGSLEDTYCLVSVRPDWHEPSDLLGYTSRLSGKAEYIVTDVLQFMVKAWKEIFASGLSFDGATLRGTKEQLASIRPFWLCLDEMNLAPVEQYFADYLSILETRSWKWNDKAFSYSCDALLKPTAFIEFFDEERFALQNNLGVHDSEELWNHFKKYGIAIPFNLIVVGTVNMDETTHGFSRKVIDRALSFDFGTFFPNHFDEYFEPKSQPKTLSYPYWSDAKENRSFFPKADSAGEKCIQFLTAVNSVLQDSPFQLAYRALNELLLSIIAYQPQDNLTLQAIWDDFLMQKVLPRIEGDLDKLAKKGSEDNILKLLQGILAVQLAQIWEGETRPDLYREAISGEIIKVRCRSQQKIEWMIDRLELSGFTNFWP